MGCGTHAERFNGCPQAARTARLVLGLSQLPASSLKRAEGPGNPWWGRGWDWTEGAGGKGSGELQGCKVRSGPRGAAPPPGLPGSPGHAPAEGPGALQAWAGQSWAAGSGGVYKPNLARGQGMAFQPRMCLGRHIPPSEFPSPGLKGHFLPNTRTRPLPTRPLTPTAVHASAVLTHLDSSVPGAGGGEGRPSSQPRPGAAGNQLLHPEGLHSRQVGPGPRLHVKREQVSLRKGRGVGRRLLARRPYLGHPGSSPGEKYPASPTSGCPGAPRTCARAGAGGELRRRQCAGPQRPGKGRLALGQGQEPFLRLSGKMLPAVPPRPWSG